MGQHVVYYSMTLAEKGNAAAYRFVGHMCPLTGNRIKASPANYLSTVIEGNTENSGFSDLNRSYAGRWTNIPEPSLLPISDRCRNSGGSGATLRAVSLRKPAIEKEARLRSQQFTFSRSRMGNSGYDAHARDTAVAQRLYSATLEERADPQMRSHHSSGGL